MTGSPDTSGPEAGAEQPLLSHLLELRQRLLRVVICVVVLVGALSPFANTLYSFLAKPLIAHFPKGGQMIAIEVGAPFMAPFKLATVVAVFLAIPYVLHQIWGFVAPGLYRHERRLALPLLITSTALFYLGAAFAYFVVFPVMFAFLTSTVPEGVAMMTDINHYLDFTFTLFIAFGVAFETPVVTFLLVWIGVVSVQKLVAARPYIIVAAFVIGAILSPPDPVSQTLLAVPMWLLFELGLWSVRLFMRRRNTGDETQAEGGKLIKPSE
ncbi:MAG: twin-arginine translocase subunit TatC [Gammaproteobacteria bacterium]